MWNIFKPNDWKTVWSDYGIWDIKDEIFGDVKKKCFFKIEYSKSRNKYKIKTEGYDAKGHSQYGVTLQKLVEFNNKNSE